MLFITVVIYVIYNSGNDHTVLLLLFFVCFVFVCCCLFCFVLSFFLFLYAHRHAVHNNDNRHRRGGVAFQKFSILIVLSSVSSCLLHFYSAKISQISHGQTKCEEILTVNVLWTHLFSPTSYRRG